MWELVSIVLAASSCPAPKDACAPWPDNLERVMKSLEALPAPRQTGAAPRASSTPAPKYFELVDRRLQLNTAERQRLSQLGFVVLGRSSEFSYVTAYHELYQSQLPTLVTADSVMHGVFRSHDVVLEQLEAGLLRPTLGQVLETLAKTLEARNAQYPKDAAQDVRLYLQVAEALSLENGNGTAEEELKAMSPAVAAWVKPVDAASEIIRMSWVGGTRLVDFSMFRIRGHYEDAAFGLGGYFRASMWLSRMDFVLARHAGGLGSDRELQAALVLADVVEHSEAAAGLETIDAVTRAFVGSRTDVAPQRLRELAQSAGATMSAPHASALLQSVVAEPHISAPNRPTGPGEDSHPYTTALLSGRKLADTEALGMLVNGAVPDRPIVHAGDVGFILGHDSATALLEEDFKTWPSLKEQLPLARAKLKAPAVEQTLYTRWLTAIGALSEVPGGTLPSFMKTPAFANLRMATALTAYGQLKHNNVLYVDEAYEEGGCEVPDGYVEPALATWEALLEYVRTGRAMMSSLKRVEGDEWVVDSAAQYFSQSERVLTILRNLSRLELANQPLPQDAKIFLSLIVEQRHQNMYMARQCEPAFDGWYFSLLYGPTRHDGAGFIASTMTSSDTRGIAYLGAREPRLGVFVVDTGGPARLMVGPVASPFEYLGKVDRRLADSDVPELAKKLPAVQRWETEYLVPAAKAPSFRLACTENGCEASSTSAQRVRLLFHGFHRDLLGSADLALTAKPLRYQLVTAATKPVKGVRQITVPPTTELITVVVGEQRVQASLSELADGLYVLDADGLRVDRLAEE